MNILLVIEGAGTPLPGVRFSGAEGISESLRYEIDIACGFLMEGIANMRALRGST
jgi:hypothetical protein